MADKCEDVVMPFGKHKNKTMREILQDEPSYLDWLNGTEITSPVLREAVKEMNEKYAHEINGED